MAKRTGNSSINSSIRQNTAVADAGFTQLLDLQRLSTESLKSMNTLLSDSLVDTMKDIAKSLKQSSPGISSHSVVNNSNSSTAIVAKSKEDQTEAQREQDKQTAIFEKIELNTRPGNADAQGTKPNGGGLGLGVLAAALAATLGAMVGTFKAQLKAIKYFAELFTPSKIMKNIASISEGIATQFNLIKATISDKLSGVGKVFESVIESIKSIFSVNEESKIGKFISSISKGLSSIFAPFIEAFTEVKKIFSGPASKIFETIKDTFSAIGSKFSAFGEVFKKFSGIFQKLFLPITIIMTIWDTVKGAIEGFEKEGIVGGIKGAITGFFNSLILGPADMIKDAIAWVAGIFGFENAKKELESFSFEKMFSDLINTLFEMPKAIGNWVVDMYNKLKSLEIPKIAFTIPVINKEISVGPFKPFAGLPGGGATQSNDTTGGSVAPAPAAANIAASPTQSGVAPSQSVAQTSSQVSAMKENQSSNITSNVVSPTVNNNVKQTQVAKIDAPVRSEDSSVDRYFSSRARFV